MKPLKNGRPRKTTSGPMWLIPRITLMLVEVLQMRNEVTDEDYHRVTFQFRVPTFKDADIFCTCMMNWLHDLPLGTREEMGGVRSMSGVQDEEDE